MLEFCLFGRAPRKTSNIMKSESFHAEDLVSVLRRSKIATMPELKKALGTEVDVTVFRKLKQLSYRTSYSHRGSYYTLDETAQFDEKGLWSFNSVWFSAEGTLLATAEALVENSEAGYFVEELDGVLAGAELDEFVELLRKAAVTFGAAIVATTSADLKTQAGDRVLDINQGVIVRDSQCLPETCG